jgi:hypothetical protein
MDGFDARLAKAVGKLPVEGKGFGQGLVRLALVDPDLGAEQVRILVRRAEKIMAGEGNDVDGRKPLVERRGTVDPEAAPGRRNPVGRVFEAERGVRIHPGYLVAHRGASNLEAGRDLVGG